MDVEKEIRKILWGKSIVKAKDREGVEGVYLLRCLTVQEQNELDFIYEQSYQEALDSNVLTRKDLEFFYLESGIWTEDDDQAVFDMEKEKAKLVRQRSKIRANKTKIRLLTKKIDQLEEEILDKKREKVELFSLSAENHAEEIMNRFMIYMSALNRDGTTIWPDFDSFLDFSDETFIYNLTIQYIKSHMMTEKDVRTIARSGPWRYRWSASKNGESLFGRSIAEWSQLQSSLVYWSQYYDYVYESPDKPGENIIEDDAALDQWMLDMSRENKKKSLNNKQKKPGEFLEEFVMVEDGDKETIEEIYNENTRISRSIIKDTNKMVKEKGRVKDIEIKKHYRSGGIKDVE